jgi:hypothetical protein
MSLPKPIYVSPSTTFVQVDPLESPYSLVFLSTIAYPGQVVSIRDATSSLGALATPIVVSTQSASFSDGSISTLINQPQGFITAQTLSNNTWAFLNSFPFRNQFLSAGVQNLTTSTLFTALGSTIKEFTGSIVVENLLVTGNFLQNQGLVLNTNLSSLGTVEFTSSLSVWGNTYLSENVSSIGVVNLFSSLRVYDDFFTKSSISVLSSVFVSSSLYVLGAFSTSTLLLKDGIFGSQMTVDNDVLNSVNVAGNTTVANTLRVFDSMNVGGKIEMHSLQVNRDAFFKSSASLYQDMNVSLSTSLTRSLSTIGGLGVGGNLDVGLDLTVKDTVYVFGNGSIENNLTIGNTLVTSSLKTNFLEAYGDYSNTVTIARISSVFIQGNLGAGFVYSPSTVVALSFSTFKQANIGGNLFVQLSTSIENSVSTLSHLSVGKDVFVDGHFSTLQNVYVSTYLSTTKFVDVQQSTILNYEGQNTSVIGSVYSLGDLFCDNKLTISSIILTSSLLAFDFTTNALHVGTYGIFSNSQISKLTTSSVTVGYIPNTEYQFDLSGSILMEGKMILSSPLLSTTNMNIVSTNGLLNVKGGMGVGVEPSPGSLVVQPIGYFSRDTVSVFSTLSTNIALATDRIFGTYIGDASQMTNFNYPKNISVNTVKIFETAIIDSLENGFMNTSTIETSTFTNIGSLYANSTLTVGAFTLWGNAVAIDVEVNSNILQAYPDSNLIYLNGTSMYGDGTGSIQRKVAVNEDFLGFPETLFVKSTIAVEAFHTGIFLNTESMTGKNVKVQSIYGYSGDFLVREGTISTGTIGYGNTYLSTGRITIDGGSLFLSESDTYDPNSNSIQTYQSTLIFNSTFFVNRELGRVGINTAFPNYQLDVQRMQVTNNSYVGISSIVKNQIAIQPQLSTFFYAFIKPGGGLSNALYSANGASWENAYFLLAPQNTLTFVSQFSVGLSPSNFINQVSPENRLPQYYLGSQLFSFNGSNFSQAFITYFAYVGGEQILTGPNINVDFSLPDTMRGMATDGSRFVAVATTNAGNDNNSYAPKIFYTSDPGINQNFQGCSSNIFPVLGLRSNGGYAVAYGGIDTPVWIAVGCGCNVSAYRSTDAINWNPCVTNLDELRDILTYKTPVTGTRVFLATGGFLSGTSIVDGLLILSSNAGVTWTYASPPLFTGSGLSLATDGVKVVVGGESSYGSTIWYAYLNESNVYTWTPCEGSLFSQKANSVIYTGSNWLAGGLTGLRQSDDGITWYQPSSSIPTEVYNLGFTSNAATTISLSNEQSLAIQDSPYLAIQNSLSIATISYYTSSILNINNACILDSRANLIVPGVLTTVSPLQSTSFTSTFYAMSAYISSMLSTNRVVIGGSYFGISTL